jgi:hypothetical protein
MARPLLTATFWLDTLERTIRTAAQTLLGAITASQVALDELDWQLVGLTVGTASLLAVLMSIVASGIGEPGTASVLNPAPPDTLDGPPPADGLTHRFPD